MVSFLKGLKLIEYLEYDEKAMLAFKHAFHDCVSLKDLYEALNEFLYCNYE